MDARDRSILRLAGPAVATLAVQPVYGLVDTAIVGHLGTAALGGVALATTVLTTSFFAVRVLEWGVTARVSYLTGAGDRAGAASIAAQGLWLALAGGAVLSLAIGLGGRAAAGALGGRGDVLDAATTYLRIGAVGVPFLLLTLVGVGFLRGVQDTRTPLWIALVANAVNAVLEVAFVYGLDLGVAGSAWSTVIAEVLGAALFARAVYATVRRAAPGPPGLAPRRAELARLLRSGGHLSVRTAALLATLALATSVAARTGPETLAGHQIALQIETFLALVVDGLAIAAQALVGTALGAGRPAEAREVGRRLLRWGALAGAALAVAVVATAGLVPGLFSGDPGVRDRATLGLLLVGVLQLPAAGVFVLDGVLVGASDTSFQQWANVAAFAMFCPCAYAVLHLNLGIVGIWCGLLAWMTVRLAANAARFRGDRWVLAAAGPVPAPA